MATAGGDFLFGDDLDLILSLIEEDSLKDDADINSLVSEAAKKIPDDKKVAQNCHICGRSYLTSGGLARHINTKHDDLSDAKDSKEKDSKKSLNILPLSVLTTYIEKSVLKLSDDECYPEEIMKEFQNFDVSEDVVSNFHKVIETDLVEFNGDAEKYYPKIYKSISEAKNPFLSLSHQAGLVVGFDIANYILAELSGVSFKDDTLQFDTQQIKLDKREKDIVHYVAGYVFTTLHNRINYQNTVSTSTYKEQCLAILLAGKADTENDTTEQKEESRTDSLVKAFDRGGLWSVKQDTFEFFLAAELHFKRISVNFKTKIDSKQIVPMLMKNSAIITQYSILKYDAGTINEEISQNLLEDILMLFIRVRSFAYANNKIQLHKAKNNSLKSKSLRTEIKKSTKHLEQGH